MPEKSIATVSELRCSTMNADELRALIASEREQGRAFAPAAEAARLELARRSDQPVRRAC